MLCSEAQREGAWHNTPTLNTSLDVHVLMVSSSIAKGGARAPHWREKYAKYHVFSAFETDFCSKNENSPPPMGIGMRTCEGLAVIWTKSKVKTGVFFWTSPEGGQKNRLNLGEDLFFVLFWRTPPFRRKNRFNFGEDLFF